MDRALISMAAALAAGLLAAAPGGAAEPKTLFVTHGYRYVPASGSSDAANAEIGMALCGARCNALSADYQSYEMTMDWRLTKVGGAVERVVDLGNPFLDGTCVCTGDEYRVEYYYYRPGVPSADR